LGTADEEVAVGPRGALTDTASEWDVKVLHEPPPAECEDPP
jgi:hypothetical protein